MGRAEVIIELVVLHPRVGCGAGVSQVALWAARVVGTLDEVDRSLVRR